jgi:ADP-heptose:LPS heptosyltransferase
VIYLILIVLLKPLLYPLSLFRPKKSGSLVIQSAKIGDYINTTVMFEALGRCDVAIESINLGLAKNDARIEHIWVLDAYKRTLVGRLALGFGIFWRGYETIYVATPNNLNLFLAIMGHTKISTFKHYKSGKTAKALLRFCNKVAVHTKENLTLDTYLKLINNDLDYTKISKNPVQYNVQPTLPVSMSSSAKKVGIALSAGNKIKELGLKEWKKIFELLDKHICEIHIFGIEGEKKLLDSLLKEIRPKNAVVSHLAEFGLDILPLAISKTDLFIASDTAGVYIADSYNIPVIVYAGPCYMKEQRPIGKRTLIVASNAPCVPFSFIFNAPYHKKCDNLYDTTDEQQKEIEAFISEVLA